ncbi:MAG: DUF2098 domain-containing protein [Methanohalobium sp.]|uniref:DUF2098 domain-containing protein n=1 Tax=Methanohalobium sp. TaxID=2837493 RepID=UPI0039782521
MAETENKTTIKVTDINGSPIEIGTNVGYINTGTVGKVTDIKEDEDGLWVLIDKKELYYKPELLEITETISRRIKEKPTAKSRPGEEETEAPEDISHITGGG